MFNFMYIFEISHLEFIKNFSFKKTHANENDVAFIINPKEYLVKVPCMELIVNM